MSFDITQKSVISNYKTEWCKINQEHERLLCWYAHPGFNELRRPVYDSLTQQILYQPELCQTLECSEKTCNYCHNRYELLFHPQNYKQQPCQDKAKCLKQEPLCPYNHKVELKCSFVVNPDPPTPNENTHTREDFDLDTFKTKKCEIQYKHNMKQCVYYHNDSDKRRSQKLFNYSLDICKNVDDCDKNEMCNFPLNKVEQLYHSDRYKSKLCHLYPDRIMECQYGDYCSQCHDTSELSIEQIDKYIQNDEFFVYKYKTVWCPNTFKHDRRTCVYAHNVQDFRRSMVNLQLEMCEFWSTTDVAQYYLAGCPFNLNCKKCHGWKELEYHPMNYKTKACVNKFQCNKKDCAFYHSQKDRNNKGQFLIPPKHIIGSSQNKGMPLNIFDYTSNYVKMKGLNQFTNFKSPIIPDYTIQIIQVQGQEIAQQEHREPDYQKLKQVSTIDTTVSRNNSNDSKISNNSQQQYQNDDIIGQNLKTYKKQKFKLKLESEKFTPQARNNSALLSPKSSLNPYSSLPPVLMKKKDVFFQDQMSENQDMNDFEMFDEMIQQMKLEEQIEQQQQQQIKNKLIEVQGNMTYEQLQDAIDQIEQEFSFFPNRK